jgi:hypothetical protein
MAPPSGALTRSTVLTLTVHETGNATATRLVQSGQREIIVIRHSPFAIRHSPFGFQHSAFT